MARKVRGGAAAQVAARINAQMKSNVIKLASDDKFKLSRVPTGSLSLDRLTFGGFARGRHVEVFGDWQVGKSLIVYKTLIEAQRRGEVCAIVDGENVFNAEWFAHLGGDPDSLLGYRPKTANELGNVLQLFLQDDSEVKGVDVVGIDSVASLLPEEELRHDFEDGDARVGSLARLMSLLLRKVTSQNDDTLFLWTNQWRDKISRIPGLKSTPGGLSLGFYASTRIEMTKGEKEMGTAKTPYKGQMSDRKRVLGQWVHVKLAKEKTGARPEDSMALLLDFETRDFDQAREIIDLGMRDGIIQRKGDYFHITGLNGEQRSHGIKRTVAKISEDEELRDFLIACIEEQTAVIGGVNGES